MPPRVAPLQVIVIPIPGANLTDEQRSELAAKTAELAAQLRAAGVRVQCDDRDNYRPGWKYNHWEVKVRSSPSYTLFRDLELIRCLSLIAGISTQQHMNSRGTWRRSEDHPAKETLL